jgi:hypothetical protein
MGGGRRIFIFVALTGIISIPHIVLAQLYAQRLNARPERPRHRAGAGRIQTRPL